MTAPAVYDYPPHYPHPDPIGGPRCHHLMVAAWCSWCLGVDESQVPIGHAVINGTDMVAELTPASRRDEHRRRDDTWSGLTWRKSSGPR